LRTLPSECGGLLNLQKKEENLSCEIQEGAGMKMDSPKLETLVCIARHFSSAVTAGHLHRRLTASSDHELSLMTVIRCTSFGMNEVRQAGTC